MVLSSAVGMEGIILEVRLKNHSQDNVVRKENTSHGVMSLYGACGSSFGQLSFTKTIIFWPLRSFRWKDIFTASALLTQDGMGGRGRGIIQGSGGSVWKRNEGPHRSR